MREKIVRHRLSVPGAVNIRVSKTRTAGPRNKQKPNKKVMFALTNTPTQNRAKRIKIKLLKFTQDTNWKRTS